MTLRFSIEKPGISACEAALASCAAIRSLAGLLDHRAEHAGELVQQHRVDLDLVVEGQVEVVVAGPGRRDRQPPQQHRGGRLEEQLVPAGQPGGQVAGPDSALLGELAGLAVDRLHPVDGVGPDVRVLEQAGEPAAAGLLEPLQRLGVGAGEVERAGPAVLVVEQRIAATQIGQRVDPLPLSGADQFQVTRVVWFCHGAPFARDPSASPSESQQTELSAGDGKSGNRVPGRRA